jgi:hypothetical protein
MPKYLDVRVTRFGREMLTNAGAEEREGGLVVTTNQSQRLQKGALYAISMPREEVGIGHCGAYTFVGRKGSSYFFV